MNSESRGKFNQIYLRTKEKVYRIALYFMKNTGLAEEIYQDTYLELYRKIDEIDVETAEYWLESVVKHKAVNALKKTTCESEKYQKIFREELRENSAEYRLLNKEREDAIEMLCDEILARLQEENARWYEAVVKVYGLERRQREVAEEMGLSEAVMRAMLFRARKWIREHYGDKYTELIGIDVMK